MSATTRRTARKSATTPAIPANLEGVVKDAPAPAPRSVRSARKTATPATPAATTSRRRRPAGDPQGDALVPAAAATILMPNGGMVRHTEEYEVDLMADGVETERDFDKLLDKEPSETHEAFVAWFEEHSGYKCDVLTVQYVIATWVADFQRSPGQKAKTIQKRLAAAAVRAEKAKKTSKK